MKPACCLGFSQKQIDRQVRALGLLPEWQEFITGQTGFMCKKHGLVTYVDDWERFLRKASVRYLEKAK